MGWFDGLTPARVDELYVCDAISVKLRLKSFGNLSRGQFMLKRELASAGRIDISTRHRLLFPF